MLSSLENFTSDIEILKAVMLAEVDAANFYTQLAEKAESKEVKDLLLDIAQEEDVHLNEAKTLLEVIDPSMKKSRKSAEDEVLKKFGF